MEKEDTYHIQGLWPVGLVNGHSIHILDHCKSSHLCFIKHLILLLPRVSRKRVTFSQFTRVLIKKSLNRDWQHVAMKKLYRTYPLAAERSPPSHQASLPARGVHASKHAPSRRP